ncbi:hypothetical protein [Saccharothrix syringae]|uniref:hypothetical protein n=1 Tax=Saccharothrix syringae TaxID=103733 RepID=UPI0012933050|nr:hypothetical protein [Saccharothrix syringae]
MNSTDLSAHAPFAFGTAGLVVLSLVDPPWWPATAGWVAASMLFAAWVLHSICAQKR